MGKRTECYSVRLQSLSLISPKCYKATAFNGSEALIPASQVFGQDYSVQKSDAYWITKWILEQKDLQYSNKKSAFFDSETRRMLPNVTVSVHVPVPIEAIEPKADESLTR